MNTEPISFQKVLDSLLSDRREFPRRYLQEFSDIGTLELKILLDMWPRVELSRKLTLLEELDALAESDTLVSFDDFASEGCPRPLHVLVERLLPVRRAGVSRAGRCKRENEREGFEHHEGDHSMRIPLGEDHG